MNLVRSRLAGPVWGLAMALALVTATALYAADASAGPPLNRTQALAALAQPEPAHRVAALERLAHIGQPADVAPVMARLADTDEDVREAAQAAVWQLWGKSGDGQVDRRYAQGLAQMQAGALPAALVTFNAIVRLKPGFAEGWNKRATLYYLMGDFSQSLKDCDEVLKRNPRHFGALSGAGQMHLQLGDLRRARDFFKRALQVNPHLEGPARLIPLIDERLQEDDKNRT